MNKEDCKECKNLPEGEVVAGHDHRVTDQEIKVICPYCGNDAEWVSNDEVYGKKYGDSYMIYLCRPCNAYVGCHENTRKPLGTMANKILRDLRQRAHAHFDPIWKSGRMSRKKAYELLSKKLGREIHIGESDEETCKQIIGLNF